MPLPFLGRLNIVEYVALIGSFFLVGLEAIIRILTLALPPPLLNLLYRASRRLFNRLTSPAQKKAEQRRKSISTSIQNASDFTDLCAMYGYTAEEHVLQTKDGYLLGVHRLAWRKGEEDMKVNDGPASLKKPVVYLHHGLLMNSEVWVCLTDASRCLPFVLVDRGYDVWLGNNRGNKYSKKSVDFPPTSTGFWDFSIDEFAFHDIPDSINYVLESTRQTSLSYIGFSQGTAQAFAALSIHPRLNEQVNVFIALAPAMSPAGLNNGIVDALIKASPQVLFLLFGRRSILSSATMWQSILYPPIFIKVIDLGLSFLFGWRTKNISVSQKLAAYPHLYSFTSTKSVVHWFQIIRNKSFQMYDDDVQTPLSINTSSKYTKVAKYPTRNIKTPIVLVYGGSDSLVDIKVMLRELPNRTVATEIPHYEHLDFLWARDVNMQVFQHVFDALENFRDPDHTLEEFESYRRARSASLNASNSLRHTHRNSEALESDSASVMSNGQQESNGVISNGQHKAREDRTDTSSSTQDEPSEEPVNAAKAQLHIHPITTIDENIASPSSPDRPKSSGGQGQQDGAGDSLDAVTPTASPSATKNRRYRRSGSAGSVFSLDSLKEGRGIKIGAARPTTGSSSDEGMRYSKLNDR
ncbi:alpha/beta-hydrolase [Hypoxylon cercidicola]|nr:alpha/beta-hydrolase [Hypoxylon cercidicola]